MTNHYHVVIETPEGNLSRGMRQLNGVYTQYINRRYRRVGHVFQGRYGKWGQVLQNNILTLIHCVEQHSSSLHREPRDVPRAGACCIARPDPALLSVSKTRSPAIRLDHSGDKTQPGKNVKDIWEQFLERFGSTLNKVAIHKCTANLDSPTRVPTMASRNAAETPGNVTDINYSTR